MQHIPKQDEKARILTSTLENGMMGLHVGMEVLMEELKQAIDMLSESIQKTTELFYTQREAEGYQAFGVLLEPMAALLDRLFRLQAETGKPEFSQEEIARLLNEAMNAMEARDSVLLADILQYDFLDQLEQIGAQL